MHVVEHQSHGVIADRVNFDDRHVALAADRLALGRRMPLNLRARAQHAQEFGRKFERFAVVEGDGQHGLALVQPDLGRGDLGVCRRRLRRHQGSSRAVQHGLRQSRPPRTAVDELYPLQYSRVLEKTSVLTASCEMSSLGELTRDDLGRRAVPVPAPLIDPFARAITYLRVSVTDRCDFRCVYCMSENMTFLPKADVLSLEELDRLCSAFIAKGVRKLRLTGGEPLVRRGVMRHGPPRA